MLPLQAQHLHQCQPGRHLLSPTVFWHSQRAFFGRRSLREQGPQQPTSTSNTRKSPGVVKAAKKGSPGKSTKQAKRPARGGSSDLLVLEEVSKTHDGDRILFKNVSFTIRAGDKLAVAGANGAGKTTLLRLLTGEDVPDSGMIQRRKALNINFLAQDPVFDKDRTAMEVLLASASAAAAGLLSGEASQSMQSTDSIDELASAADELETAGNWDLEHDATSSLKRLGISNPGMRMGAMSGGQRRRVALAAALMTQPDMLILDEPTNHLDIQAIEYLEQTLKDSPTALIVVSHDRWFMENLCTQLLELHSGTAYMHSFGGGGSYAAFVEARAERRATAEAAAARARTQMVKEAEWMRRQPKARSTKQAARIDRFHTLSAQTVSTFRGEADVQLDTGMKAHRQGTKVINFEGVCCNVPSANGSAPRRVLSDFYYNLQPGERLGIVGPNGAGKSTLLRLISGASPPVEGLREQGETVVTGFLTQDPLKINEQETIVNHIRYVWETADAAVAAGMDSAEKLLERLGFPYASHQKQVGALSGGERRRLQLGGVLASRPNVLLLDEPTNDLDIATVEQLEQILQGWQGCVIVASHDRALLDAIAPRLLVLPGDGRVQLYDGRYSQYAEWEADQRAQAEAAQIAAEKKARAESSQSRPAPASVAAAPQNGHTAAKQYSNAAKLSWRVANRRELEELQKLEREVDELERVQAQLNQVLEKMMEPKAQKMDQGSIQQTSSQLAQLSSKLEVKTGRWMDLAARAEAAGQGS